MPFDLWCLHIHVTFEVWQDNPSHNGIIITGPTLFRVLSNQIFLLSRTSQLEERRTGGSSHSENMLSSTTTSPTRRRPRLSFSRTLHMRSHTWCVVRPSDVTAMPCDPLWSEVLALFGNLTHTHAHTYINPHICTHTLKTHTCTCMCTLHTVVWWSGNYGVVGWAVAKGRLCYFPQQLCHW